MRLFCYLLNNWLIEELLSGGQVEKVHCWETSKSIPQLLTRVHHMAASRWSVSPVILDRLLSLNLFRCRIAGISFKYQVITWFETIGRSLQKSWKPGGHQKTIKVAPPSLDKQCNDHQMPRQNLHKSSVGELALSWSSGNEDMPCTHCLGVGNYYSFRVV